MARPKKDESIKRTKNVMVRFTDVEYALVSCSAEQAGYPVAVYVRKQAITEKLHVHYNIVADIAELRDFARQLSHIGNSHDEKFTSRKGKVAFCSNRTIRKLHLFQRLLPRTANRLQECCYDSRNGTHAATQPYPAQAQSRTITLSDGMKRPAIRLFHSPMAGLLCSLLVHQIYCFVILWYVCITVSCNPVQSHFYI